jgi:hypothetical protein
VCLVSERDCPGKGILALHANGGGQLGLAGGADFVPIGCYHQVGGIVLRNMLQWIQDIWTRSLCLLNVSFKSSERQIMIYLLVSLRFKPSCNLRGVIADLGNIQANIRFISECNAVALFPLPQHHPELCPTAGSCSDGCLPPQLLHSVPSPAAH